MSSTNQRDPADLDRHLGEKRRWLVDLVQRAEDELAARGETDEAPYDYAFGLDH